MYDQMYPRERQASLGRMLARPEPEPQAPGFFTGLGSALADAVPHAATTAMGTWSQILDAYGKAAAFRDAPVAAALRGDPAPDMQALQSETIDQMGDSATARRWRRRAKDYEPDPEAVGVAGQVVHGVASSLTKAGAYAATTGPLAPFMFGADVGVHRAGELMDQGADGGTAALGGAATGVAGAVGLRLPAALGATRLQSAAIGAALNPALNIAEVGGIRALLEHANYPQIAARYEPFDPTSMAVAAITGAAFGAAFHGGRAHTQRPTRGQEPKGPTLTPDEHAAALTMHEVRTRESDTLVMPSRINETNTARDAQTLARQQLESGERVSVAHLVDPDPVRLQTARERVAARPIVEALQAAGRQHGLGPAPLATVPAPFVGTGAADASITPNITAALGANYLDPQQHALIQQIMGAVEAVTGRSVQDFGVGAGAGRGQAQTPEQMQAAQIATNNPDAMIASGDMDADGQPIYTSVRELMQRADEVEQQARTESKAFRAAILCATRYPA